MKNNEMKYKLEMHISDLVVTPSTITSFFWPPLALLLQKYSLLSERIDDICLLVSDEIVPLTEAHMWSKKG